jgi:hypothetical protein
MSKGRFRFSTGIFRHLGEELNPHPDQGILELVKNAYDADARHCLVEFHDADQPGGWIRIEDDGDGMELEDIRSGWLVLGESKKSAGQRTRLERSCRLQGFGTSRGTAARLCGIAIYPTPGTPERSARDADRLAPLRTDPPRRRDRARDRDLA